MFQAPGLWSFVRAAVRTGTAALHLPQGEGRALGLLLAPLGWGLHSVGSEEDRQRESMREGSGMSLLQFDEKCACPEMKL